MSQTKKNQHFVPKFYLRNFSSHLNGKEIGVYNTRTEFCFDNAPLKSQGSRSFFYGHDGQIEEGLSEIETQLAPNIKKIINTCTIPPIGTKEHIDLLSFVILMHLRNPVLIDYAKLSRDQLRKTANELHPGYDFKDIIPDLDHELAVKLSLSHILDGIKYIEDLHYKLLINKTIIPFITSDYPIIKYNKFLEEKRWIHGKTGYGNVGLQLILPLNPEICIIFYDQIVYKVGFKKRHYLIIDRESDVDQLNILQFLNSSETIYFNNNINKSYLYKLHYKSSKYRKANQTKIKIYKGYKKDGSYGKFIGIKNTECEIGLQIKGMKKSSRAAGVKFHSSIAQLRPIPLAIFSKKV